ncbi:MAG TPA: RsmB/NOP family class I SAM-dependent RNA methyltransferase [Pseudobdellovibrionaceae bacterium]|nr:RsmB/NOP family class I SAM-dependent RNA methyltransferase [Pseudobdellovibrionaceae bacterium]
MSSKKKNDSSGAERFEEFYRDLFKDRWTVLKEALQKPERQVLRSNRHGTFSKERFAKLEVFQDGIYWQDMRAPFRPERSEEQLLDVYIMDPASLAPAFALEVQSGEKVLDLCAAPGGKTLILAEALFADGDQSGELVANDLSPERRGRLIKVLQQYIPREIRDGNVFVTGKDGVQFGLKQPEEFDRILLDAPCSGERHLLENPEELKHWSPRRSEGLATRQYSLLCAAWLALKPGGRIVYSTCALSNLENDGVIRKFLKKKEALPIREFSEDVFAGELRSAAEPTEFGWQFLPDRSGIGPIYFAVLGKASV